MFKNKFFFSYFLTVIIMANTSFANSFLGELSTISPKGKPIYIQIFKQEQRLDLYQNRGIQYELIKSYPICKYSGGLGPKKRQGDLKSPEGFYSADITQLKPDSQYHRAINIGFPNEYDRQYGYTGDFLMIHGDCVSVGCYAMLDSPMQEIYEYAESALYSGQTAVPIHIFPFEMTEVNLNKYRGLDDYEFWLQLSKGYEYFKEHKHPPEVDVYNGKYVVISKSKANQMLASNLTVKDVKSENESAFDEKSDNLDKKDESDSFQKGLTSHSNKIENMIESSKNPSVALSPSEEDEKNLLNSIKLAKEQP